MQAILVEQTKLRQALREMLPTPYNRASHMERGERLGVGVSFQEGMLYPSEAWETANFLTLLWPDFKSINSKQLQPSRAVSKHKIRKKLTSKLRPGRTDHQRVGNYLILFQPVDRI